MMGKPKNQVFSFFTPDSYEILNFEYSLIKESDNYIDKLKNHKSYRFGNYMFKVNYRNTRTRYEICLKLTITTPERCQVWFWCL